MEINDASKHKRRSATVGKHHANMFTLCEEKVFISICQSGEWGIETGGETIQVKHCVMLRVCSGSEYCAPGVRLEFWSKTWNEKGRGQLQNNNEKPMTLSKFHWSWIQFISAITFLSCEADILLFQLQSYDWSVMGWGGIYPRKVFSVTNFSGSVKGLTWAALRFELSTFQLLSQRLNHEPYGYATEFPTFESFLELEHIRPTVSASFWPFVEFLNGHWSSNVLLDDCNTMARSCKSLQSSKEDAMCDIRVFPYRKGHMKPQLRASRFTHFPHDVHGV